ncbi:tail fiber assembly protein [Pseudomonas veronii]|uniref:tail fiber assembly protein n=1 Tax=Pseudomonas veronii TaxID=76761 RepID=UPI00143D4BE2|nr:tail fiber assembly protein [Pseudomonas veronii]
MSGFAVRDDGDLGWRSIASIDELFPNEVFSAVEPLPASPPEPSVEELSATAKEQRDKLLAVAANRMGPLQDAVDTGRATNEEVAQLAAWKGYRIDLNRIEQQEGFPAEILWPLSPDESSGPEPIKTPTE